MLRDRRFQELPAEDIEAGECALLVASHQPAIADDICRKDGRKAALNVLFGHRERPCLSLLRCELMAERPGCLSRATIFRVWATHFRFSLVSGVSLQRRTGSILNAPVDDPEKTRIRQKMTGGAGSLCRAGDQVPAGQGQSRDGQVKRPASNFCA